MADLATPNLLADQRWSENRLRRAAGEIDPRVARSRDRALAAARTVLLEEGWEALTQQRVAEVAGIGRATVYRLWPDRVGLLHDVCVQEMRTLHTPPTADLAADLRAELTSMRHELVEHRFGSVLVAVTDRSAYEHALGTVKSALVRQGSASMRHRLNLAIDAGELAADLDVDEALAFLIAPLVYRIVFADQTVTDGALHRTVEGFLALHRGS
jgi:AcrR family transcriptional regulator